MTSYRNCYTESKFFKNDLSVFLKESGIYYECSGCGAGWHFEIKCSEAQENMINDWIDEYSNYF